MSEPKTQVALLPEPESLNPIQLLQIAVAKGVDTEQLKQLMELQREWKGEQARDAFFKAMNAFRSEAIHIVKTKQVAFKDVSYKHATLAGIVEATVPALSKHGLSHRWETKQEGQLITVACIVTHELGHSAQTSLSAAPDQSGSKNSIQAIGSTVSYLQRYTFMAITGLAAKDQDNDAQTGEAVAISPDQATAILDKLEESGSSKAAFLNWLKADHVETILAKDYERAMAQLDKKIAGKKS
jgi:hypothetical protein